MKRFRVSDRVKDTIFWILLLSVVIFSVYRTQATNNDLTRAQLRISDLVRQMAQQQQCTEDFFGAFAETAAQRTELNPKVNEANTDLLTAQGKLIGFLVLVNRETGPVDRDTYTDVLNNYFNTLTDTLRVTREQDRTQRLNPYPTKDDYRTCLKNGQNDDDGQ